jgi:hypothetical protein
MAADPGFLLRLYAKTGRLLQQQDRQGRPIRHWRAVVICPSRELHFGDPTPVQEFVHERLVWIELAHECLPQTAPPLLRALGMLLLPEEQLPDCSKAIRAEVAGTSLDAEIDDVIAAILVARFSGRSVPRSAPWNLSGRQRAARVLEVVEGVIPIVVFDLGRKRNLDRGHHSDHIAQTHRIGEPAHRLLHIAATLSIGGLLLMGLG